MIDIIRMIWTLEKIAKPIMERNTIRIRSILWFTDYLSIFVYKSPAILCFYCCYSFGVNAAVNKCIFFIAENNIAVQTDL